jgi:hypothetical protein
MDSRIVRFQRQQAMRVKPQRDPSIERELQGFIKEQSKLAKALGNVAEAFEAVVPAEIASCCTLVGVKGGVLTVETSSASARYALDRVMRGGAETELRQRAADLGTRLLRVKLVSAEK